MQRWQFNVLFVVGVSGAVLLLIGPSIGIEISKNPNAVMGLGAILAYIFAQKLSDSKKHNDNDKDENQKKNNNKPPDDEEVDDGTVR